jgi:hypothetical protein
VFQEDLSFQLPKPPAVKRKQIFHLTSFPEQSVVRLLLTKSKTN